MKQLLLHDSTLLSISYEWAKLACTIDIGYSMEADAKLILSGVTMLQVPQERPWGRSVSINDAQLNDVLNPQKLEIEMQSGDTLNFVFEQIEFYVNDVKTDLPIYVSKDN
jgi:hypothetical protein